MLLSPARFAEAVGVSDRAVRLWCAAGRLPGLTTTPGGHYRIPPSYVALVREGRLPLR
jgi:excisionase family DNA binding protein